MLVNRVAFLRKLQTAAAFVRGAKNNLPIIRDMRPAVPAGRASSAGSSSRICGGGAPAAAPLLLCAFRPPRACLRAFSPATLRDSCVGSRSDARCNPTIPSRCCSCC